MTSNLTLHMLHMLHLTLHMLRPKVGTLREPMSSSPPTSIGWEAQRPSCGAHVCALPECGTRVHSRFLAGSSLTALARDLAAPCTPGRTPGSDFARSGALGRTWANSRGIPVAQPAGGARLFLELRSSRETRQALTGGKGTCTYFPAPSIVLKTPEPHSPRCGGEKPGLEARELEGGTAPNEGGGEGGGCLTVLRPCRGAAN